MMIIAALLAPMLSGAVFQDIAGLDRAVAAFTGRPIGAEGGPRTPVDPRLRLAACPTVALSWRTEAHDAVVVTCAGPDWRLFVPVIRPELHRPHPRCGPRWSRRSGPSRSSAAAIRS